MHFFKYQVYLFDFDGLLVDTEKLHYASYMEMSRRRGCPLTWDFKKFCKEAHSKSMGFFDAFQKEYPHLFQEVTREILYEEKKRLYLEMLQNSPLELMEGVESLLTALESHQVKRAVVTNSPKHQVELIKKALPILQTIPLWVTREDYSNPKPSPEGYLKAISILAEPEDKIIGFEDTLKGLQALLGAGAEGVLVCSLQGSLEEARKQGALHFDSLSSYFSFAKS